MSLEEAELGYEILQGTTLWLREKNIQQWVRALPRDIYFARQERGENFGLFADGDLAGILSLTTAPHYWTDSLPEADAVWMSTLTTANDYRGRGIGGQAVRAACEYLKAQGNSVLYLDCKPGFLQRFYAELGFEVREARTFWVEEKGELEVVLMRKSLV